MEKNKIEFTKILKFVSEVMVYPEMLVVRHLGSCTADENPYGGRLPDVVLNTIRYIINKNKKYGILDNIKAFNGDNVHKEIVHELENFNLLELNFGYYSIINLAECFKNAFEYENLYDTRRIKTVKNPDILPLCIWAVVSMACRFIIDGFIDPWLRSVIDNDIETFNNISDKIVDIVDNNGYKAYIDCMNTNIENEYGYGMQKRGNAKYIDKEDKEDIYKAISNFSKNTVENLKLGHYLDIGLCLVTEYSSRGDVRNEKQ